MLYPITTSSRSIYSLDGLWNFTKESSLKPIDVSKKLTDTKLVSVPASFNDQVVDSQLRGSAGYYWYERTFAVPSVLKQERLVLRFGSATHEAWVYLNGQEITHHKGGFTPFEVVVNDYLVEGENHLLVRLSNLLDYTTLPVGNYSSFTDENGELIHKVDENFDFFNYAGLHRHVWLYSTPWNYIEDVTIVPEVDLENSSASVNIVTEVAGDDVDVRVSIIDENGTVVTSGFGKDLQLDIKEVQLWQPLHAYLYTAKVELLNGDVVVDSYEEPFGIRKVEVKNGKFYINGRSFYFKGFGKHEDTYGNGRGINEVFNVMDIQLMKQMGANSFRTSHYPYSEEMMRLCDREGIVVIDETPAVGLMLSFDFNVANLEKEDFTDSTWNTLKTHQAHEQVIRELIARDKNHACVVMWSIANEAANYAKGAYEYFKPLFDLARSLDPQKRPCTYVSIMMSKPNTDKSIELVDVIALNRYYGWYITNGDLIKAEEMTRQELQQWQEKYPDKPIMYTEYGADTVAGFHSAFGEPFSEEYQEDYYRMNSKVFDEFENFVGEQLWNFADFQTKFGIFRVQGNKKGIFTRAREPKMTVRYLSERWNSIPHMDYK